MSWSTVLEAPGVVASYITAIVNRAIVAPAGEFALTSLATAFVLSAAFLLLRRPRDRRRVRLRVLVRALLPRRWWRSASGQADIGLAVFNLFLFGLLLGWAVLSSQMFSRWIGAGLTSAFGAPSPAAIPDVAAMAIVTVVLFLAYELGYWVDHFLAHRIPFLWELHKVHHAAETLSPLTNARVHPGDTLVFYNINALFMGVAGGITYYLLGRRVPELSIYSANAFAFLFGYLTSHLHHSHMWIAFTGLWGKLLISPAHHQIHHSTNPIHFDKNLGSSLAVFDWLFGTLHIPQGKREKLAFGIGPQAVSPHSLEGAMIEPVRQALSHLTPARTPGERTA